MGSTDNTEPLSINGDLPTDIETKDESQGACLPLPSEAEHEIEHSPIKESGNIATIPTELILHIFNMLSKPSSVCLGLTCRRVCSFLKTIHSQPISLSLGDCSTPRCRVIYFSRGIWMGYWPIYSCDHWNRRDLWQLLENWMGPEYKVGSLLEDQGHTTYKFVKIFVYSGQLDTSAGPPLLPWIPTLEGPLGQRYLDWAAAGNLRFTGTIFFSRLPNPSNKGDSWYREAISAIRADVPRWGDIRGWSSFWARCEVFKTNQDKVGDLMEEFHLENLEGGNAGWFRASRSLILGEWTWLFSGSAWVEMRHWLSKSIAKINHE